jgi:hypothetical protein
MSAAAMSLFGLVAAARDCFTSRVQVVGTGDPDYVLRLVTELIDGVLEAARGGDFFRWREAWLLDDLSASPAWEAFCEVCALADRIDSLLVTLERGSSAALARGCRDDLDGLLVLGDWCEDHALPCAATELRHLHGLVRDLRTSLGAGPVTLVVQAAASQEYEDEEGDDSEME